MEDYEGKMPCLVDNGEPYTESSEIADYIEYFYPEPPLNLKDSPDAIAKVMVDFFHSLYTCLYLGRGEILQIFLCGKPGGGLVLSPVFLGGTVSRLVKFIGSGSSVEVFFTKRDPPSPLVHYLLYDTVRFSGGDSHSTVTREISCAQKKYILKPLYKITSTVVVEDIQIPSVTKVQFVEKKFLHFLNINSHLKNGENFHHVVANLTRIIT